MTDTNGSADAGNPGGQTAPPEQNQPWYSSIDNPDLRGFAELKKWENPGAVIESYRNLESHIGVPADRLLKLPDKADAPEWKAIHEKLGFAAPEKADDYTIHVPEGASPDFANQAKTWAHKHGIPARMMEGLSQDWNTWVQGQMEAETQSIQAQEQADLQQLQRDWGSQYAGSVELARRAARDSGFDEGTLSKFEASVGTAAFMRFWAKQGSMTHAEAGAHGTENPGRTGFALSPEAAQAKIDQLKGDKDFFKRYSAGDVGAVNEWQTLNKIAAGA